ncbi:hypothetical protein CKO12_11680 [Chromatium okenii]|uniref:LabA-like NYN domain-containing protein n=1 Tax=Chromatium okenii TaxID=61644 RepID=UPI001905B354|nr:NYN domain-containing protein [Chromatium okenii]MBK1642526.1 hypothetical protein [Chromatium okenii]
MEKLVIFNDYANIAAAYQQQNRRLDHDELFNYLSEGRFLVEAHAFVPIDPRNPHARDQLIDDMWNQGYMVHSKIGVIAGDTYRCNLDVEITLEMMHAAETIKPDIIVLISGDKDFIPVVLELRRRGIRVEIAAFPGINAARELMLKGSGFIDLHTYQQECETPTAAAPRRRPLAPAAVTADANDDDDDDFDDDVNDDMEAWDRL